MPCLPIMKIALSGAALLTAAAVLSYYVRRAVELLRQLEDARDRIEYAQRQSHSPLAHPTTPPPPNGAKPPVEKLPSPPFLGGQSNLAPTLNASAAASTQPLCKTPPLAASSDVAYRHEAQSALHAVRLTALSQAVSMARVRGVDECDPLHRVREYMREAQQAVSDAQECYDEMHSKLDPTSRAGYLLTLNERIGPKPPDRRCV